MGYLQESAWANQEKIEYFVQKVRGIKLSPAQLMELGLIDGWQERVPAEFIVTVVDTAERFREDLQLLARS